MASNNMELGRWRDGIVRLVYWDYIHGEDKVFLLENGQAYVEEYNDHPCDDGTVVSELVKKPVNLAQALVELHGEMERAIEGLGND